MVVDLDLNALKAKNLKAQDIVDAVNAQNLILPSGFAPKIRSSEYDLAAVKQLATASSKT